MGQVSGYVLATDGEPTVCVAGDAIWTAAIADALRTLRPDVTVLNTGEARWVRNGAPDAQIVAVHMEGLNRCLVTWEDVRRIAESGGFADRVLTPADGETLAF